MTRNDAWTLFTEMPRPRRRRRRRAVPAPTAERPRVGDKVMFGRKQGEKTLGAVIEVNRTRAKIKQLESRGVYRDHQIGTVWAVPFSLLSRVDS